MRLAFTAFILFSNFCFAAQLQDFYSPQTLLINVGEGEIQHTPIWKNHGEEFDRFLNVPAFSNQRNGFYQCTELAHRFLKTTFGIPTQLGIGLGNAKDVVQNIAARFRSGVYSFNSQNLRLILKNSGEATEPPAPGSALNFDIGPMGHVAIVRYVEVVNATTVKVYLIEQHGFPTWQPGHAHPIRSVVFTKNITGKWAAARVPGVGLALSWINFQIIE
ncbi:MAG: hypothetical protein K0R29_1815 [Pseudobdellovibrio sp.]|jgi:hypothetical protein|nr:hypothetical protein [Pseudobdellovibrio sp.]